ncbi:exo-beta-N-acetylmuramidase NamZ family protein [Soonwooa purpurea]
MILKLKIKQLVLMCLIYFGITQSLGAQNIADTDFRTGADQPELYLEKLRNKNIIIVANQTSLLKNKQHLVDYLVEQQLSIKSIFAPEHGFRGDADAGEHIKNGIDAKTKLPIVSLYGANKKPSKEQLKDVDLILFDIQDAGVRFYTYISTLTYVMEAAAENNIAVMVLDRPNPHDGYIDGPILKSKWSSFVGLHPVPVVYGLTIGEYGEMVNGEKWLKNGMQCQYEIIPMKNYHKNKPYPISERPSPNLPNDLSINLYPSLCFFEGTEVSVGRGTEVPFQIYGSPWIKNMTYRFTPKPNYGAKDPFLNGQLCYGEDLSQHKTELRKLELSWLLKAYKDFDHNKKNFFLKNLFFDKLAGSDALRKQLISGKSEKEIRNSWKADLENFSKIRAKYMIYPN